MNTEVFEKHLKPANGIVPNCHVMSCKTINSVEDECLEIVWIGKLFIGGETSTPEALLRHYQGCANFQTFYDGLEGQFWLLVKDEQKQTVHLVNDHLAIQPCYYTVQEGELWISESLDVLRTNENLGFSLSSQAIYNYFYYHCIPAPNTIFEQANKLIAGSGVTFDIQGKTQQINLYHPLYKQGCVDDSPLQQQCLDTIEKAVGKYVTDDCGAFLSGGLDSSTVAGMLAKQTDTAKTFSMGFDAKDFDETPYAKLTAEHFGTEHEVIYLQPEQAAEAFVDVAQYFDEPFGNSSAMAAYFCAKFAKEKGINRMLAGDGGDELFAGNERYAKQKVFEHFHQAPSWLQVLPRAVFTNSLVSKLPVCKKVASYINQADVPLPGRLETYNFINQFGHESMFSEAFLKQVDITEPSQQQKARYDECSSEHPVDRMLYLDWKFTLADNDLVKVNKMCELAGVEVVYPLLDKSVVDFSCEVPADVKLPGGKLRDFYKKACTGFLADDTLTKSKHGFGLPFGIWMKQNDTLKTLTLDCLNAFRKRDIIKPSLIDDALKAHESVHASYYGELIWIMVVMELWLQGKGIE